MQKSYANYEYFIETPMEEFIGEWVVICEGKIVAHGRDVKEVVKKAQELQPNKKFMVVRVPDKEMMIF